MQLSKQIINDMSNIFAIAGKSSNKNPTARIGVENGKLKVEASNDVIHIHQTLSLNSFLTEDISTALPDEAVQIFARCKSDTTLNFDLQKSIVIKSGLMRAKCQRLDPTLFSIPAPFKGITKINISGEALKIAIAYVSPAVNQNTKQTILSGIYLKICSKGITAIGTNGHVMAIKHIPMTVDGQAEGVLPIKGVKAIQALPDAMLSLHFSDNSIQVTTEDGLVLTSRLISGKYPEIQKVLEKTKSDVTAKLMSDQLREILQSASFLIDPETGITLQFANQAACVSCGKLEHKMEMIFSLNQPVTTPWEVAINPDYLLSAMGSNRSQQLTFKKGKEANAAMTIDSEDGQGTYVIMPMTVRN